MPPLHERRRLPRRTTFTGLISIKKTAILVMDFPKSHIRFSLRGGPREDARIEQ
jgi:hypothetical protein